VVEANREPKLTTKHLELLGVRQWGVLVHRARVFPLTAS
jgi:hypothetical protein